MNLNRLKFKEQVMVVTFK